jgi:hypothetical protein
MNVASVPGRTLAAALAAAAALAGLGALAPTAAQAGTAVLASAPAAATAAACGSGQVLAWVGLGGQGGTARGVRVPLEFTNVSRGACTIYGYPRVQPAGPRDWPAAPAAARQPVTRPRRILLRPGQTAHGELTIAVARGACRKPVLASAVLIRPPGIRAATRIGLVFSVCAHRRTLTVSPVRAGTGIP